MIGKRKPTYRIDAQVANPFAAAGADGGSGGGVDLAAPPLPPTIPAPTLASLTPSLLQSAVTPSAQIAAVWTNLETNDSETYRVQVATDSGFSALVGTFATGQNQSNAVLAPLKCSTLYYIRVQAIVGNTNSDWSNVLQATTPADTIAPDAPTGLGGTFAGIGDLVITWVNPTSANLRDVEISIWSDSGKTTLYATVYDATGRYVWTAAANLAATSGVGDPTVYVELRSRSYNNVFSAVAVVGTITKAAPVTPGTITHNWSGDTGAAGAHWSISWAAQSDAAYYLLNINALGARRVYGNTYTYTLDKNIADNGSADPTLSYSLVAVDGLNQSSSAATGTATNAAPAAPAVTLSGGIGQAVATISTVPAADFAAWEYVWKRDGATVRTLESRSSEQQYEMSAAADSGAHSWTVVVRQKDAFGQYSGATTSSAVTVDALTTDYLRASLAYSDSIGSTFTPPASGTLAALKDATTASGGVSYAA